MLQLSVAKNNRSKHKMKKIILALCLFSTFGSLALLASTSNSPSQGEQMKKNIVLCGHCGEVKGSTNCCKEDAQKCGNCKLQKGSPGCCAMEKGKDVTLCSHCGEIAGGEKCCKMEGREKCSQCGLFKGSPGCKAKCSSAKSKNCATSKSKGCSSKKM
jgi:hypothetical protein